MAVVPEPRAATQDRLRSWNGREGVTVCGDRRRTEHLGQCFEAGSGEKFYAVVTTTIRRLFDGRSTVVRLLIMPHMAEALSDDARLTSV